MNLNKTITSAFVIALITINAVLRMFGIQPLDIDYMAVYDGISAILLALATVWGVWKNHNFTKEAVTSQTILDGLKGGYVDAKEVYKLLGEEDMGE